MLSLEMDYDDLSKGISLRYGEPERWKKNMVQQNQHIMTPISTAQSSSLGPMVHIQSSIRTYIHQLIRYKNNTIHMLGSHKCIPNFSRGR